MRRETVSGYARQALTSSLVNCGKSADLAVVCDGLAGRVAISIEGKADETFGRTVGEEIVNAAAQWAFEERDGKLERIRLLVRAILPRHRATESWLST